MGPRKRHKPRESQCVGERGNLLSARKGLESGTEESGEPLGKSVDFLFLPQSGLGSSQARASERRPLRAPARCVPCSCDNGW